MAMKQAFLASSLAATVGVVIIGVAVAQDMGSGMMRGGAGHGMMMRGDAGSGMGTLFGSHVVPTLNLSEDDVRGFLIARLDRLNNKRLKLGEVKADDSTITADVVTVDNSLVQRLKVDRHTGDIEYEN